MIATLIIFLLLIIFFAFFIGKNLSNVCTFWLFKTYTDLPVAVLVLIAFGAGIVFSILCVMIAKFKKSISNNAVAANEEKREKTEKKLKKLSKKNRKQKEVNSSDVTIVADK